MPESKTESRKAKIILQARRARPFYGRHPWVYAGAIANVEGAPADGDEVDVYSHGNAFIARGLYNSRSRIRVRLYSWQPDQPLDRHFFRQRLEQAIHLRRDILGLMSSESLREPSSLTPHPSPLTNACRLVFSEGDGLSGMIVDRYDRWLVLQFTGFGLAQRRDMFVELLVELLQPEGIYLRTERGIGKLEGLDLQDGPLWGSIPNKPVVIEEDGIEFLVNVAEGQKTGFYLDQRDNRRAVARFAAGRRVLDAFCYTGAFSLHALRAGAKEIVGVDASEPALELARQNIARNGLQSATFIAADVFDYLQTAVQQGDRFGLIILDPPKFARAQHAVEEALRGYRRLQTLALLLLEPHGILVTCCCSGLIDIHMIESLLAQVSAEGKRTAQILERRGQAPDHPVSVSCLESYYLKCLIAQVV